MKKCRYFAGFLAALVLSVGALMLAAAQYAPPPSIKPSEETLKKIEDHIDKLEAALKLFRRERIQDLIVADVEIYLKAAQWITQHNEFYDKDAGKWTVEALERGLMRASQVKLGEWPWFQQTGAPVIHGYRSAIDGSVQPYAVMLPADYGKGIKKWRLEVVLHGRQSGLTEVSFLHQFNGEKPAPKDQDYIRLDVYGRGNNGYRWAGESDIAEVLAHFINLESNAMKHAALLDTKRSVLRGFSMGGAGTWHLGLHVPDQWCVISPGAGFTTTHGYIKGLPDKLPSYQEACLRIYDAVEYAENAFNVPIVAYGGENDPQLQAARNIEERLRSHAPRGNEKTISMKLLVAPGLKHEFPPAWQKKMAEARNEYIAKGREDSPPRVRFVTYTLKYPRCYWVYIWGMDRHYEKASVDAQRVEDGFKVKTHNVRALRLQMWEGATRQAITVQIDGDNVSALPYEPTANSPALVVDLQRREGHWRAVLPGILATGLLRKPQKFQNFQGPIDDAFTGPFLCVRGTGSPWHEATEEYARANLERFRKEWSKYFRGELPVKDDVEVEPQDFDNRHLILFGDPSSNSLIAQALPGLPFTWTKEKISCAGKDYPAGEHVPMMIYPSPFSPNHRYVVLNSGHTFHAQDFQGSNALLYPRLGDYAIVKLAGDKKDPLAIEVTTAGLFDDFWRPPETLRLDGGGLGHYLALLVRTSESAKEIVRELTCGRDVDLGRRGRNCIGTDRSAGRGLALSVPRPACGLVVSDALRLLAPRARSGACSGARRRTACLQSCQLSRLVTAAAGASSISTPGGVRRLDQAMGRASSAPVGRRHRHRRLRWRTRFGARHAAGPCLSGSRRASLSLRRGPRVAGRLEIALSSPVSAHRAQGPDAHRAGLPRSDVGQPVCR